MDATRHAHDVGTPAAGRARITWAALRALPARTWIPMVAVLLASLAVTALGEWSARGARRGAADVATVLERLRALADVESLMLEIESGERGYLLTRDPSYLEPFTRAARDLPLAETRLRALVGESPAAQAHLRRAAALAGERVRLAAENVRLFNAPETRAQALRRASDPAGRRLDASFHAEIQALEHAAEAEVLGMQERQSASAQSARLGLAVTTALSIGLLVTVLRLFLLEAAHQERRRTAAEHEAKELERLVEQRTLELSRLSTHLQEFAEKEKSQLAHDLHDELGGLLTAAKMDLSWLQSRLAQPGIQERLAQLGAVLDEAMNLKRRVVEDLRPSLLEHFGIAAALRSHVEATCRKSGLQYEIDAEDPATPLSRDVAIALFRVAQEGLTNVVRHAGASRVRLRLAEEAGRIVLELADDGRGMDPAAAGQRASHGLTGMRHRVRALGGRFTIESAPGRGTCIRVALAR